jgi:hypothetical protein
MWWTLAASFASFIYVSQTSATLPLAIIVSIFSNRLAQNLSSPWPNLDLISARVAIESSGARDSNRDSDLVGHLNISLNGVDVIAKSIDASHNAVVDVMQQARRRLGGDVLAGGFL